MTYVDVLRWVVLLSKYLGFIGHARVATAASKTPMEKRCLVGAQDANSTALKVQAASVLKLGGVGVFTGEGLAKAGAASYWQALQAFKQPSWILPTSEASA
jgi:hypothetical protein